MAAGHRGRGWSGGGGPRGSARWRWCCSRLRQPRESPRGIPIPTSSCARKCSRFCFRVSALSVLPPFPVALRWDFALDCANVALRLWASIARALTGGSMRRPGRACHAMMRWCSVGNGSALLAIHRMQFGTFLVNVLTSQTQSRRLVCCSMSFSCRLDGS